MVITGGLFLGWIFMEVYGAFFPLIHCQEKGLLAGDAPCAPTLKMRSVAQEAGSMGGTYDYTEVFVQQIASSDSYSFIFFTPTPILFSTVIKSWSESLLSSFLSCL